MTNVIQNTVVYLQTILIDKQKQYAKTFDTTKLRELGAEIDRLHLDIAKSTK